MISDHCDFVITRHVILVIGIGVMLLFTFLQTFTTVRKGKYFNILYFFMTLSSTWLKILWIIVILSTLTWALTLGFRSGENSQKNYFFSATLFLGSCTNLISTRGREYWKYLTNTLGTSRPEIQTRLEVLLFSFFQRTALL